MRDYYSGLSAERAFGREEGLSQGLSQGLQQSRQEERRRIARELLAHGVSMDIIAASTHLSTVEIKQMVH